MGYALGLGPANLPINTTDVAATKDIFHNLTNLFDRIVKDDEADGRPLPANETNFSFAVFDQHQTLHTCHHSADESALAPESTKTVNDDTIYRIGSVSKLVTVYTFLVSTNWSHWQAPITRYLPELAERSAECSAAKDPIDYIDWDEVTLESLAGQLSGIPDGFEPLDGALDSESFPPGFLPPSGLSTAQKDCNSALGMINQCSSSTFISGLAHEHPVFAPWDQPSYSNGAYQLLAAALERTTNSSFPETLQANIFDKLNMTSSYSSIPPASAPGVIPFNQSASQWNTTLIRGGPEGGLYSSTADLVKLGQGIMKHSLLSPVQTRRWMKPLSHTSSLRYSVGAPWEIFRRSRREGDTLHSVDLYTKGGDIGGYHTVFALIPQYDIGYVVLTAGSPYTSALAIDDQQINVLLNGLDDIAHQQAAKNMARTYTHVLFNNPSSNNTNTSLILEMEPNAPGLNVTALIINGTDFPAAILGGQPYELRTYPTELSRCNETRGTTLTSWRMLAHPRYTKAQQQQQELQDAVWLATSNQVYGYTGLNGLLVETEEGGRVVGIEVRVLDVTFV
ncbi:Putative beta-lactamase/transpeptidase [Septoria linicola]|uniref:Beta-lactamase/transpeptidase n=1 Tax=Septoria linicola TaxID=215465 RepID=A0A9Q9EMC8_9PEZI|nr:putative beta-lactamase/transpeptidase [Septoria linicola]USW55397.1 Putative beta-lactamase/transpeptidase [Septoria linicola]